MSAPDLTTFAAAVQRHVALGGTVTPAALRSCAITGNVVIVEHGVLTPIAPEVPPPPKIVCISGSTRFADEMNFEAEQETLLGRIVVRPEVVAYHAGDDPQLNEPEVKAALDELHLRKIDLADEVLVVMVDGYIGESTRREIDYAERIGKPVKYHDHRRPAATRTPEPPDSGPRHHVGDINPSGNWDGSDDTGPDLAAILDEMEARIAEDEGKVPHHGWMTPEQIKQRGSLRGQSAAVGWLRNRLGLRRSGSPAPEGGE